MVFLPHFYIVNGVFAPLLYSASIYTIQSYGRTIAYPTYVTILLGLFTLLSLRRILPEFLRILSHWLQPWEIGIAHRSSHILGYGGVKRLTYYLQLFLNE